MKRAFAVLVLFAGYNSGLIVPSFASKFSDETTPNNSDSQSTHSQSFEIDLKNSNSIDEKELFQTGTGKENVLNERAFIYINKQYKPILNSEVYNSRRYSVNKPFVINERSPQTNVISLNNLHANQNPQKQLFIPNVKGKSALKTKYNPPSFKDIDREVKMKFNDDRYFLQKAAYQDKIADGKYNQEIKTYSSEDIKHHHEKSPDMTLYPRYRVHYNYGFPSVNLRYSANSGHRNRHNGITLKEDNMSTEGSLATDNIVNLSPLDLKDEDVLLDRYIKEALNSLESKEANE